MIDFPGSMVRLPGVLRPRPCRQGQTCGECDAGIAMILTGVWFASMSAPGGAGRRCLDIDCPMGDTDDGQDFGVDSTRQSWPTGVWFKCGSMVVSGSGRAPRHTNGAGVGCDTEQEGGQTPRLDSDLTGRYQTAQCLDLCSEAPARRTWQRARRTWKKGDPDSLRAKRLDRKKIRTQFCVMPCSLLTTFISPPGRPHLAAIPVFPPGSAES